MTDSTLPKPKKPWRQRGPRERKQSSIEFLSRLDVARIIGCSKAYVHKLEKPFGSLTPYKFPGQIVRYSAAEVRAMIERARAAK